MLSGLRSAFLQVVATATVAAYVGLGGLGRYLQDGIATNDYVSAAGGAIVVSVLALIVDGVLALVQRLVVSPGLTGRSTGTRGARRGMSETGDEVAPESESLLAGQPDRPSEPSPRTAAH